jgi:hypothetical protein
MKRLYYFYVLLLLTSCNYSGNKETYEVKEDIPPNLEVSNEGMNCIPNTDEISAIVRAVIKADSLQIQKGNAESIPLSRELQSIKFVERQKTPQPPTMPGIFHFYLTHLPDFLRKDPDFTFCQSERLDTFSLDTALYSEYLIQPFHQLKRQYPTKSGPPFYSMSYPLFNKGFSRAYVKVEQVCAGWCSDYSGNLLEKISGEWVVVKNYYEGSNN